MIHAMKVIYIVALGICLPNLFLAQDGKDVKAIKAMCGCHEVKFSFAETFSYPKDSTEEYKPSKVKHEYGLEWVQLVEDRSDKIVLQHLLVVGEDMVIKHWRQDWLFENTDFYTFDGFDEWKFNLLDKKQVKGQWTQKVYQVDDSPRYEGTASWIHKDGRHFWESTSYAPLPRREYTMRTDYNLMKRVSVHEIVKNGWIHDQDNDKIVADENGNYYLLAQEKGTNTYTKVDDSRCVAAQNWWKENQALWEKVRTKWNVEYGKNKHMKLKEKVDGNPLYRYLFKLDPNATQQEVDEVINRYIVNQNS